MGLVLNTLPPLNRRFPPAEIRRWNSSTQRLFYSIILINIFYADGFGKDYKILNLDENHKDEATRRLYLTACMVSFYQQIRFFQDQPAAVKKYNLEKPLLVLVGARVNVGVQDVSDLEFFLCFLANFIKNESAAIADLDMIMKDEHGLYAGDKNIFAGAFDYLRGLNQDSADLLADMKLRVFHNAAGGGVYH